MKKFLVCFSAVWATVVFGQTFPVNNLQVNGTSTFSGPSSFTVGPTAPTASTGTSNTQLSTTAFVQNSLAASGFAPLVSPGFSGTPTAPIATRGTNNTQIATTAFVVQHDDCANIMDYGGNNLGTVDNSAAFAAAASAGLSGLACVKFPPGIFAFSGQLSYTFPANGDSLTIRGAGQDVTKVVWNGGQGMQINFLGSTNSVHIRDMSFTTAQFNTGAGLFLYQTASSIPNPANTAGSDITNVTFVGASGYGLGNYYWEYAFEDFGVSNINFYNDMFFGGSETAGQGAYIYGNSSLPPVVFNFIGCTFNYWSSGINYGNYVQGMTLNYVNMGGVTNGIYSASGLSNTQSELNIVNSQFGGLAGAAINLGTAIAPMSISNSLFEISPGQTGIFCNPCALLNITGSQFIGLTSNTSNTGIDIDTMSTFDNQNAGIISGNLFFGLFHSIYLDTGSSNINVQSNTYRNNGGTNVTNNGTGNTIGGGSQ